MKRGDSLSKQLKSRVSEKPKSDNDVYEGNFKTIVSTGSTLLDLIISGRRVRGGGIPTGIFVEIYGPESSGKTALLCEIGGNVQKINGTVRYLDPEGRIDNQYAQMFGISLDESNCSQPDTVTEVFQLIRDWKPEGEGPHCVLTDSLAALSTDTELSKEEGDKMGGRRAKEFSEGLRKTCRILKSKNYLLVASNQLRDTFATFGKKQDSPGGKAIRFYASLRLETNIIGWVTKEKSLNGKTVKRTTGVKTEITVVKSSVGKPKGTAPVTIIFDYGIDNIRDSLQYIKDNTENKVYTLRDKSLGISLEKAIRYIEDNNLENDLREEVITLWEEIESKFDSNRKPKNP